MIDTGFVVTYT